MMPDAFEDTNGWPDPRPPHWNDAAYLVTCRIFGITPSADDYAEYLAEAEASAPDDD